jgi:hypothetical protein
MSNVLGDTTRQQILALGRLGCRVGDPDRKGKVEAGVGHAKKTPLRGLRFESLDEAQAYPASSR